MRSLPLIKETIEKQLALFPQDECDLFGDDTVIRLRNEEELLQRLLVITNQFIEEQAYLEHHLEAYV